MSSGKATAVAPVYDEGEQEPISLDLAGNVRVTGSGGGGAIVVIGNDTPSDAFVNPTDFVGTWSLMGGWDAGGSIWRRAPMLSYDLGIGAGSLSRLLYGIGVVSSNYAYNGLAGTINPMVQSALSDAQGNPSAGLAALWTAGFNMGYDNTAASWKRLRADASGYLRNVASPPANADTETAQFYSDGGTAGMVGVARAARAKALAVDARCAITLGGWFQLFNKATNPVNGDTAVMQFHVAVNSEGVVSVGRQFFGETGQLFTTGLAYAFSSTADTLTIAADSPWSVAVSYV